MPWIDGRLADIDRYAARYPDAFADELERHAGVARDYTLALLVQPGWRAGDAWFACFLGRAAQATCRSVVRSRARADVDATRADIAAGLDAALITRLLRPAPADSYRRWDRPLQADPALTPGPASTGGAPGGRRGPLDRLAWRPALAASQSKPSSSFELDVDMLAKLGGDVHQRIEREARDASPEQVVHAWLGNATALSGSSLRPVALLDQRGDLPHQLGTHLEVGGFLAVSASASQTLANRSVLVLLMVTSLPSRAKRCFARSISRFDVACVFF